MIMYREKERREEHLDSQSARLSVARFSKINKQPEHRLTFNYLTHTDSRATESLEER